MCRSAIIFAGCSLFLSFFLIPAAAAEPPAPPPEWLLDHMRFMVEPEGVWITDNSEFRSEQEPADAYGTAWEWGIGKTSLRGRLFGLADGKEIGEYWQYRVFWHPETEEATMIQFGSAGILGMGPMWIEEDGTVRSEMTFWYPGRGSERIAHDLVETDHDSHLTRSFGWKAGEWAPRRQYIWKRQQHPEAAASREPAISGLAMVDPSPELESLAFLVGEWEVDGTIRFGGRTLTSGGNGSGEAPGLIGRGHPTPDPLHAIHSPGAYRGDPPSIRARRLEHDDRPHRDRAAARQSSLGRQRHGRLFAREHSAERPRGAPGQSG